MIHTRREFFGSCLAAAALPSTEWPDRTNEASSELILWYPSEAKRWLEALPVGNGRLGAMVFGGVTRERLALSESTAWSGAPGTSDINPEGAAHLSQIRQLLFNGDYLGARKLCEQHLLSHPKSFGTNLPLFDLVMAFGRSDNPSEYRRSLNLDEGVAQVEYLTNAGRLTREVFASNPDDVVIVHIKGEAPGQLNMKVSFDGPKIPGRSLIYAPNILAFAGNAFESLHSDGKQGVEVACLARVINDGGEISAGQDSLQVAHADSITLLIAVATSYTGREPTDRCREVLQNASGKTYAQLRHRHVTDHQALFRRVQIELGNPKAKTSTPTDQRRKTVEAGADDPALCALFFQYGRYLTIAGSRANSPLPLALQGIWNDGLASSMGWTDDFHLDINTEQNYWLAEVGNLSESQTPLFSLIEGMSRSGRHTAEALYNCPGWVSHVVTNPWGYTAPGWGLGWGLFVTSGIWIALQMWDHVRFTGDMQFLRERAYPVFKEAAEFFLAYMIEHPKHGWLVTGPSDSPENAFRTPSGDYCSESMGPTCDRVLVYALFRICLESQTRLSIDADFGSRIRLAQQKLPPLQIGRYGQLQEWLEDFEEAEPNHRHTSHLIALYPENQISPEKTPALAKAARITLERRIQQPNWEDTEWSRANLVNYYARLWDGEAAHRHVVGLIAKATDDNLLTYSRGGVAGAEQNIFAIDGNTAGAAGIAEMLLQSQDDVVYLLPALPAAWPEGRVSGLCARGGFQIEMRWSSGLLVSASIIGNKSGSCRVRYKENIIMIHLAEGRSAHLTARSFRNAGVPRETHDAYNTHRDGDKNDA
ncbi:alpha-L-fucosidase 2 [Silvibacterium bohemicum]|uniref:Alpha-L-fucosidase 2 n=1 Tax=Silvibacterium bohemicum TaxID=1577686 RepID=A0A841JSG9_9BACT|nr:glycoside hydrolase family 95 protein [Silvibacterium bohemicum]MBB6144256.1 alpha-L-fucosidase 2 [Silvibacterium bohemicum]